MRIASLVLRTPTERIDELRAAALAVPGVEWQHACPDSGHVIVTLEDVDGHSLSDALVAVSGLPQVLASTLAYEYSDEGLEPQEI